jgi:hypothetical protein
MAGDDTLDQLQIVCLYRGDGQCVECGGLPAPHRSDAFCSDDCASSWADRAAAAEAAQAERRRREDAFGDCAEVLTRHGYSGTEIDQMLRGIPT